MTSLSFLGPEFPPSPPQLSEQVLDQLARDFIEKEIHPRVQSAMALKPSTGGRISILFPPTGEIGRNFILRLNRHLGPLGFEVSNGGGMFGSVVVAWQAV